MKPKHYLISFVLALVVVLSTQFIMVKSGNASCMSGDNMSCLSRDEFFNKYGWPFAYKSVSGISYMNNFSEYHPGMMLLDLLLAFALIESVLLAVVKFKPLRHR